MSNQHLTLGDIKGRPIKGRFIGRKKYLDIFETLLKRTIELPNNLTEEDFRYPHIFLIIGEGGIGKTSLTRELLDIGKTSKVNCTYVDIDTEHYSVTDPNDILKILYDKIRATVGSTGEKALKPFFELASKREAVKRKVADAQAEYDQLVSTSAQFVAEFAPPLTKKLVEEGYKRVVHSTAATLASGADTFSEWLRKRNTLSDDEFQLFRDETTVATTVFMNCLGNLSQSTPLVVAIDTYELLSNHDEWVRRLLSKSTPKILWIISGRQNVSFVRKYKDSLPEEVIQEIDVSAFDRKEIQEYIELSKITLHQNQTLDELVGIIYEISRGIPLAVEALVNMLEQGADIEQLFHDYKHSNVNRKEIVKRIAWRFLKWTEAIDRRTLTDNGKRETYQKWILALALLGRYDKPAIQNLLINRDSDKFNSVDELLHELSSKFSFIFASEEYEMHDLVQEILREFLQVEGNLSYWLTDLAKEAHSYYKEKTEYIQTQNKHIPSQFIKDQEYQSTFVSYLNTCFWIDPYGKLPLQVFLEFAVLAHHYSKRSLEQALKLVDAFSITHSKENDIWSLWKQYGANNLKLNNITEAQSHLWSLMYERILDFSENKLVQSIIQLNWFKIQISHKNYDQVVQLLKPLLAYTPDSAFNKEVIKIIYALLSQDEFYIAKQITELYISANESDDEAYFLLGDIYDELADRGKESYEHALKALDKAIEINPNRGLLYNKRAMILRALKQPEAALTSILYAIQLDPRYPFSHGNHGVVLNELGKYEEALEAFNKAIEIYPNYSRFYSNKGIVLTNLKRYDEAIENITHALQLNPKDSASYSSQGLVLFELKRYEEALIAYSQAIKLDPDYAYLYDFKARILVNLKRYEEAEVVYAKAIELDPNNPVACRRYGDVLFQLKRYREALVIYDKAIQLEPDNAYTHGNFGGVLDAIGNYEEALAAYDKAIQLEPSYGLFFINRGNVLYHLKRYQEALFSINQGLKLDPNEIFAYERKGKILYEIGDYQQAFQTYEQALELDPYNLTVHRELSQVLIRLDRKVDAVAALNKIIELKPNDIKAYGSRAAICGSLGQLEQAIQDYTKIVELNSEASYAYASRAAIYADLGQLEQAIQDYTKAVDLGYDCRNERGLVYNRMYQFELALKDFYISLNEDVKVKHIYLYNIAVTLVRSGKTAQNELEQARLEFNKLLAVEEGDALYGLAGLEIASASTPEEIESAFKSLSEALAVNASAIKWAKTEIAWQPYHNDPRFIKILAQAQRKHGLT